MEIRQKRFSLIEAGGTNETKVVAIDALVSRW